MALVSVFSLTAPVGAIRITPFHQVLDSIKALLLAVAFEVWPAVFPVDGFQYGHHLLQSAGIGYHTRADRNIEQLLKQVLEELQKIRNSPGNRITAEVSLLFGRAIIVFFAEDGFPRWVALDVAMAFLPKDYAELGVEKEA